MWSWGAPSFEFGLGQIAPLGGIGHQHRRRIIVSGQTKKAPGIAPGAGRWGSPTEEKANEQSGNCLHTHSVLVYITHISFTTPSCAGSARNAYPVKCLTI